MTVSVFTGLMVSWEKQASSQATIAVVGPVVKNPPASAGDVGSIPLVQEDPT